MKAPGDGFACSHLHQEVTSVSAFWWCEIPPSVLPGRLLKPNVKKKKKKLTAYFLQRHGARIYCTKAEVSGFSHNLQLPTGSVWELRLIDVHVKIYNAK